jgi:hypothetical protein
MLVAVTVIFIIILAALAALLISYLLYVIKTELGTQYAAVFIIMISMIISISLIKIL